MDTEKIETIVVEKAAEVGAAVAEDLIRPTSKSIGENVGLLCDGVFGWIGILGKKLKIKQEKSLETFKQKINEELNNVPGNQLTQDPSYRIIGTALEESRFAIEDETCQDMFAKLIASSVNTETLNQMHPSFPGIVKQLSPLDAKFLQIFQYEMTYPAVKLKAEHPDKAITPYPHYIFDFKKIPVTFSNEELFSLTKVIENLIHLGVVLANREIIELAYDYDSFKKHWYYIGIKNTLNDDDVIRFNKYRVELTEFGKDFVKCCIPNNKE